MPKEVLGTIAEGQKYADPHVHTKESHDGRVKIETIIDLAEKAQVLDLIAITDHNKVKPSYEAFNYAQRMSYDIEVVPGAEVSTKNGHLIALYIYDDIPRDEPIEDSIKAIHNQGGLAIVAHPLLRITNGPMTPEKLVEIINNEDPEVYLDGIEIYNAGADVSSSGESTKRAKEFYLAHKKDLGAPLGSSDNHYFSPGRGFTAYYGNFKEAVTSGNTSVLMLDDLESDQLIKLALDLFPGEIKPVADIMYKHLERRKRRQKKNNSE